MLVRTLPCEAHQSRLLESVEKIAQRIASHCDMSRRLASSVKGEISIEVKLGLNVTIFWNAASFRGAYFERGLAGCIRYQHRGQSQLLLFPATSLQKAEEEGLLSDSAERVADSFMDQLKGMQSGIVETLAGLAPICTCQLIAGQALVLPAGCFILERSAGASARGFKVGFVNADAHSTPYVIAREHISLKTKETHPHAALMKELDQLFFMA